jgi:hypothetical protein
MTMRARDLVSPSSVCAQVGVHPLPISPHDKVGLSRSARSGRPIHGLRVHPTPGVSGWYIWGGEWSDAAEFFEPSHAFHLAELCPLAVSFLSLPPGWRFLTDGDYVDVWFDPALQLHDPSGEHSHPAKRDDGSDASR